MNSTLGQKAGEAVFNPASGGEIFSAHRSPVARSPSPLLAAFTLRKDVDDLQVVARYTGSGGCSVKAI